MEVSHEKLPSLSAFGMKVPRSESDPTSGPQFVECLQPERQTPAAQPAETAPPPPQTAMSDQAENTVEEPDSDSQQDEPRDETPASAEPKADLQAASITQTLPVADGGDDIAVDDELMEGLVSSADEILAADGPAAVEGLTSSGSEKEGADAVSTGIEELPVCPIAPNVELSAAAEASVENVSHSDAIKSASTKSKRDKLRPQIVVEDSEEASDNLSEKPPSGEPAAPIGRSSEDIPITGASEVAPLEPAPSEEASRSPRLKEVVAAATEAKSAAAPVEPAVPADLAASTAQATSDPAAGAAAASLKPPAVLLKAKTGNVETARAAGEIDPAKFMSRVARAFESAHQRGSEVRLRLHPVELGALSIEVRIHDNVLTASVQAETPEAKAAIIDNLPALRERLADQGIRIDRFDVDLMDHSDRRQQSLDEQTRQQEARQSVSLRNSARRVVNTEATPAPAPGHRAAGQGGLNVVI